MYRNTGKLLFIGDLSIRKACRHPQRRVSIHKCLPRENTRNFWILHTFKTFDWVKIAFDNKGE